MRRDLDARVLAARKLNILRRAAVYPGALPRFDDSASVPGGARNLSVELTPALLAFG